MSATPVGSTDKRSYEGMIAETVVIAGHNGDFIESYFARPVGISNVPGVVVIHHMPGWDEWTKEVVRKFAYHGYAAVAPHLFSRHGPGKWDDVAAAARAAGGASDAQAMGDVQGAVDYLKRLPYSNGKVGCIGFCSGGRQTYLAACTVRGLDAAVDCWGGRVFPRPEERKPGDPTPPIEFTKDMACPLLGIFGNDDGNPDPDQVNRTEAELKKHGKTYEFHRYDGAGHAFWYHDRGAFRPEQAMDAWAKVFAWFDKYLS
ncbi:MAG TPA: dienelactone hydrolase family protein [Chloroflexota bacterium]|nr:dienelactone hydrolase family protein [Chloroflexota bacterium]